MSSSTASSSSQQQKAIQEVLRRPPSHWVGDGFKVFPVFADKAFTKELSPFLMFDYAAPKEFPPSSSSSLSSSRGGHRRGVGQHPHRGFETVTIAFQGEVQHRDSTGNSGIIGPGDCQWMTAARGIVHEEFHSEEFTKRGGVFEMCQLWVNLPKRYKMTKAKYQGILDGQIPRVPLLERDGKDGPQGGGEGGMVCKEETSKQEDGYVRVIAGSFRGEKGPAETFTPINMWDIILPNGENKEFELEVEKGHTTLIFVRRGEVKIQNKTLGLADVAIMTREGTKITVQSLAKDTSLLVLSGEPIDEPIAARGPFVMNTHQELMEAMSDYNQGRNGFHHF